MTSRYEPMMPTERAERLLAWHRAALAGGRRVDTVTVDAMGRRFVVPPSVYPPNPLGLAEIVAGEVREGDRVLDMGTGSGVNGIVAAAKAAEVIGVDVNPEAVACAVQNAQRNAVAGRFGARLGDLFVPVDGLFDLIAFDPPFRWFRPGSMQERGTADENYETLTAFFAQVKDYLSAEGRVLISFGTTGDIAYLHHLIGRANFRCEELRCVEGEKDGFAVAYFVYRLSRTHT